MLNFIKG